VTTASDQWGRFQFANVPPGEYELSVDAGQGLTSWMPDSVVLSDGESCVDTQIVLQPSGKVSGRVLTADGRPGAGIYVRLLPDGPSGSLLAQMVDRGHTTGRVGRFTFEGLGPDSYVLAVNPEGRDATGRQPYAPAFFGGADRASATRIPVGEGSAIELDRPFELPAPLATRTFTVAVTCRDGSVPPGLMARAQASGAIFAEFDETGDGPVRTLNWQTDQTTLLSGSFRGPGAVARCAARREAAGDGTARRRARPPHRSLRRSRTARKPHAEPRGLPPGLPGPQSRRALGHAGWLLRLRCTKASCVLGDLAMGDFLLVFPGKLNNPQQAQQK
jgi:hypothetical protein